MDIFNLASIYSDKDMKKKQMHTDSGQHKSQHGNTDVAHDSSRTGVVAGGRLTNTMGNA